jgi:hypothetical protein
MPQDPFDATRTVSAPAKDAPKNPGQQPPAAQAKRLPDEPPKQPAKPGPQTTQRQTFEDQTATAGGYSAKHRQAGPSSKNG